MKNDPNETLLAIFLEEAQDLLDAIGFTLQKGSEQLGNLEVFSELKRDLHTLKGGARMVSQPQLSALAHELESFCDSLLSGSLTLNREAYLLLGEGHDKMVEMLEALKHQTDLKDAGDLLVTLKNQNAAVPPSALLPSEPQNTIEKQEPSHHEFIRVRADILEKLNNLSIENNIIRVNIQHFTDNVGVLTIELNKELKQLQEKLRRSVQASVPAFTEIQKLLSLSKDILQIQSNMETLLSQQSNIETDFQNRLVDTRMISFSSVIPRLSQIARQIASELNKKVDFKVLASEGEIDRHLLEHLEPSLEHLLRNALDHGIETSDKRIQLNKPEVGTITLHFYRKGNDACIEIRDDGSGISEEQVRKKAIQLGMLKPETQVTADELYRYILEPGFSTRETVSEISGRGIGMDIVNTVVKELGGNIQIESVPEKGSIFTLHFPFTSSVNRALLVNIQGHTFGVLISNIQTIILVKASELAKCFKTKAGSLQHEEKVYPLYYAGSVLGFPEKPSFEQDDLSWPVILFNFADQQIALCVDALGSSQEIVMQALGPQFKLIDTYSGATLLADGKVILVLDVLSIAMKANRQKERLRESKILKQNVTILVVDDSLTIRKATQDFLEQQSYTVRTAENGLEALRSMEEKKPDLILLDMEMPQMNGFEFAEKVRSMPAFSSIPIIMITFCSGKEQQIKARALGIQRFLSKPYQEPELLENIESLLEKNDP